MLLLAAALARFPAVTNLGLAALYAVLLAAVREGNGGSTAPLFYAFAGISVVLAAAAWSVRPPAQVQAARAEPG